MPGDVSINVSPEVVKPIIEAKIQAAIVDQLCQEKKLVQAVVEQVLYGKVDSDGKPSRYGDGMSYIQWVVERAVRQATMRAVDEVIVLQQEEFKKAVSLALTRKRGAIAENFISSLLTNAGHAWKTKVDVQFMPEKD